LSVIKIFFCPSDALVVSLDFHLKVSKQKLPTTLSYLQLIHCCSTLSRSVKSFYEHLLLHINSEPVRLSVQVIGSSEAEIKCHTLVGHK